MALTKKRAPRVTNRPQRAKHKERARQPFYQGYIWEGVHIALDSLASLLQVQSVLETQKKTM